MPAGVNCSVPIVGSVLGEVKPVPKPRGKVFFMEQVLARDSDGNVRTNRLNILKPSQPAISRHLDRGALSSTCSSNCSYGTECSRQVSKMHGSIAIDNFACKLQPEVATGRPSNRMGTDHKTCLRVTLCSTTCHLTCRLTGGYIVPCQECGS